MKHALACAILAVALAAPPAVMAQPAPAAATDQLTALTNSYYNAILHNDAVALAAIISPTFHAIGPDGTRQEFDAFMYGVSTQWFRMQPPNGIDVKIKNSALSAAGATEDVSTVLWYSGVSNIDPMSGPTLERDYGTHQLTWIKAPGGKWLLDEDHTTALQRT
ncbi:MAG TPA: hypothetical protein VGP41_17845 [Candidatus Lustribacter sp.]|jgi:hypothetical protein|nr:hypothetical protein [Candidatus Lustribacter sp.]